MLVLLVIASGILTGIAAVGVRKVVPRLMAVGFIMLISQIILMLTGLNPFPNPDKTVVLAWLFSLGLAAIVAGIVKLKLAKRKRLKDVRPKPKRWSR